MWDPFAHIESTVLPNGLTVLALHWPERAGVHMHFGIFSGARHDPVGREGAAHYMEHMVNCNGGSSAEEMNEFFNLNTGRDPMLGTTSYYSTYYKFHSSVEPTLLSRSLDLFGRMLLHAKLEHHMERERRVIVGEYHRNYGIELKKVLTAREHATVFPETFLERMLLPLGTLESINAMTEADLQAFYDANYTPNNMIVVAVGELTLDEVCAFLQDSPFGDQKLGKRSALLMPPEDTPYPLQQHELVRLSDYVQGVSTGEYVSIAQLPDSFTEAQLGLYTDMLQELLFEEVRQKRSWAYGIHCHHHSFGGDFLRFGILSGGLSLDAIDDIENVVTECIENVPKHRALFERLKLAGINRTKFIDPSAGGAANTILQLTLSNERVIPLEEKLVIIDQLSLDDMQRISERLSRERRFTSIRVP